MVEGAGDITHRIHVLVDEAHANHRHIAVMTAGNHRELLTQVHIAVAGNISYNVSGGNDPQAQLLWGNAQHIQKTLIPGATL